MMTHCFWFVIRVGSLVGLCTQDYKSLCAAATICATLVNSETDRQTDRQHSDQIT